ncbi:MAG: GNAT family N-acetyltransferase [Bdellovibrio sp.]|nr:GNAT family N-acetyltransferase [Bdellovibrio sp.]
MIQQRPFPGVLKGPRIRLERHSLAMADQMFALIDKNREHLKDMPWASVTKTVDNSRMWIESTLAEWDNLALFDYGIYLLDSDRYMGSLGVHSIRWDNKNCELGYWIGEEFQGQGYISEAVKIIEAQCFKSGFHRVEIRCAPFNERSAQVAIKSGYKFEGELREDLLVNGQYRNTKVFGKLSSD